MRTSSLIAVIALSVIAVSVFQLAGTTGFSSRQLLKKTKVDPLPADLVINDLSQVEPNSYKKQAQQDEVETVVDEAEAEAVVEAIDGEVQKPKDLKDIQTLVGHAVGLARAAEVHQRNADRVKNINVKVVDFAGKVQDVADELEQEEQDAGDELEKEFKVKADKIKPAKDRKRGVAVGVRAAEAAAAVAIGKRVVDSVPGVPNIPEAGDVDLPADPKPADFTQDYNIDDAQAEKEAKKLGAKGVDHGNAGDFGNKLANFHKFQNGKEAALANYGQWRSAQNALNKAAGIETKNADAATKASNDAVKQLIKLTKADKHADENDVSAAL
jgi:hypothetical protein